MSKTLGRCCGWEVMSGYKSEHAGEGGFVGAGGCDDWMHDFGSMYLLRSSFVQRKIQGLDFAS